MVVVEIRKSGRTEVIFRRQDQQNLLRVQTQQRVKKKGKVRLTFRFLAQAVG